jgi:hypothetical protein
MTRRRVLGALVFTVRGRLRRHLTVSRLSFGDDLGTLLAS